MKFWHGLLKRLYDPTIEVRERLFVMLTTVSEIAVLFVFIGDVIFGEHIAEIAILGATLVVNPLITWIAVRKHNIKKGGILIAISVVFLIMPTVFIFGGGVDGGAVIWFAYAYVYIGLVLDGKVRHLMLGLLLLSAIAEHIAAWLCPWIIVPHSRMMCILDTLISVLVVGISVYIAIRFQNSIYLAESKRAMEEAEKVERMNRAQSRFFSNMSHEIRTPINTVLGLNEMIMRDTKSSEVMEDATNIQAAGKMLLGLINDILDMSKFESGQMTLTPVPYDIKEMLSEIVGILWMRAKDKKLEFSVNLAPDVPSELIADEVRIKQILINVVSNAIKYTEEGKVTLNVQCEKKEGDKAVIVYTVSDTGIGIKKENIPYLFDAFKRVDEEKNRYIEGTGLGLSIVKNFVDLMEGRITVNSVYTRGSTFIIEIPQRIASDVPVGEVVISGRQGISDCSIHMSGFRAPGARILIVDDNETNLMVAGKLLRDTGVQVDAVSSGRAALEKTMENVYQVIFMDHLMPEMDGIECASKIRTQTGGLSQQTPIVALTANAGPENEKLYRERGFDGYLVKPVSGAALEDELLRLLPQDMVRMTENKPGLLEESMSFMQGGVVKKPVIITTESLALIPSELSDEYDIPLIPYKIRTKDGLFRDGIDIKASGLLAYMEEHSSVSIDPPGLSEHESFFADALAVANNVIHFTASGKVSKSAVSAAREAAASFENVRVVDTGMLCAGEGVLVLQACRMAEKGMRVDEILSMISGLQKRLVNTFIMENLDYMHKSGLVSARSAGLIRSFIAHPVLMVNDGRIKLKRFYIGDKETAWRKYIDYMLRDKNRISTEFIEIAHAGFTMAQLDEICRIIREKISFERIYIDVLPATITTATGPGTLGLLYIMKDDV